jgi:hypothetical protein
MHAPLYNSFPFNVFIKRLSRRLESIFLTVTHIIFIVPSVIYRATVLTNFNRSKIQSSVHVTTVPPSLRAIRRSNEMQKSSR